MAARRMCCSKREACRNSGDVLCSAANAISTYRRRGCNMELAWTRCCMSTNTSGCVSSCGGGVFEATQVRTNCSKLFTERLPRSLNHSCNTRWISATSMLLSQIRFSDMATEKKKGRGEQNVCQNFPNPRSMYFKHANKQAQTHIRSKGAYSNTLYMLHCDRRPEPFLKRH